MQLASLPGICWYVTVFLKNLQNFQSVVYDPFVPCAPFLYPLKASENLTVFWCFQGVEKRSISEAWVKDAFTTLFSGTAFLRGNHLKLFGKLILISVNFTFSLCDISTKNPPLPPSSQIIFFFYWNIQLPCQISKWVSEFLKFRWNFSWMVPNIFDMKTFGHFWNKLFKRIVYYLFEHGTLKLWLSDDFKGN